MNIHIEFLAQLGQLAGGKHRTIAFDGPCTAQDALRQTIAEDSEEFRALILDQEGQLQRSMLMFVRNSQCDWQTPVDLEPGDTIVLSPPIAGG
jgi:molybdopterin converting factor small subunit